MLLTLVLFACVPKVEEAPPQAAALYCEQAIHCEWFTEDEREDCEDLAEDIFSAFWETETCASFERGGWKACTEAIESIDCDNWLTQGLQDFQDDCAEERICE